ncbi:MoaD/ThiS family protein [Microbacterium sp. p3-SID336]|uniref:MoaD/ThiS family protein n=1 Tax=Microbacterium sp. p3-SID336 TaxID=2916212 RepID=UPI0021A72759|nr:MoaD/ThiS family protein [Microbacterium sp. p3-SID336]MCT1478325.1 MoaD/ThiS family protein [Microbacterium sp. p3-SID336]
MTTVRYFAAAQDAAGVEAEALEASTLGDLRARLTADHPGLAGILDRCALLVDGRRVDDGFALAGVETVDVLPPFAGG